MNAVDGTDRGGQHDDAEPPSLLAIVLDTNPHAWALLEDSLPLSKVVVNLLVFINAHLAINHANRVAVLASHSEKAEWLYTAPTAPNPASMNGHGGDVEMTEPELVAAVGLLTVLRVRLCCSVEQAAANVRRWLASI